MEPMSNEGVFPPLPCTCVPSACDGVCYAVIMIISIFTEDTTQQASAIGLGDRISWQHSCARALKASARAGLKFMNLLM